MYIQCLKWMLNRDKYKLPPHLILYVTDRCNLRCRHCFFWKNLNQLNEFSLDELRKISSSLDKIIWLDVGGGEPFLREDLASVVEIFYKQNKVDYLNLPTNGFLPQKTLVATKEILTRCPACKINLAVSLDGLRKTHDDIRGVKGSFERALETIFKLTSLKKDFSNLSVSACTTVLNKNAQEIVPLMEFSQQKLNLDFHSLNLIRGEPKDKTLQLSSYSKLKGILEAYQNHIHYYYHQKKGYNAVEAFFGCKLLQFLNQYYLATLKNKPNLIPCFAGTVSGVVEPNGDVLFCELTAKVANLRKFDFDFKKAWFGSKASARRREFKKENCYCTHSCFQSKNLLFNPKLLLRTLFIPGIATSIFRFKNDG